MNYAVRLVCEFFRQIKPSSKPTKLFENPEHTKLFETRHSSKLYLSWLLRQTVVWIFTGENNNFGLTGTPWKTISIFKRNYEYVWEVLDGDVARICLLFQERYKIEEIQFKTRSKHKTIPCYKMQFQFTTGLHFIEEVKHNFGRIISMQYFLRSVHKTFSLSSIYIKQGSTWAREWNFLLCFKFKNSYKFFICAYIIYKNRNFVISFFWNILSIKIILIQFLTNHYLR